MTKNDSLSRFERLERMRSVLPPQQSEEWFRQRRTSGNSSQYGDMFNVYGDREKCLKSAAAEEGAKNAFPTSWGTLLECVSGYLFTEVTSLPFRDIGSVSHPLYPRIRGSVDGYGLDREGNLFVLETKTPFSRIPSRDLDNVLYLYQMIQNMEIVDGDYALFNDVRLLPCTTDDICDPSIGRDPGSGAKRAASFRRHNLAARSTITTVAASIHYSDGSGGGNWIGNIFDAYTDQHSSLSFDIMRDLIVSRKIRLNPFTHTALIGEEVREWSEKVYSQTMEGDNGADAIGCLFFKVDVHNIQRIDRPWGFWDTYLKPTALRWIEDIDRVIAGEPPSVVERHSLDSLPSPVPVSSR